MDDRKAEAADAMLRDLDSMRGSIRDAEIAYRNAMLDRADPAQEFR